MGWTIYCQVYPKVSSQPLMGNNLQLIFGVMNYLMSLYMVQFPLLLSISMNFCTFDSWNKRYVTYIGGVEGGNNTSLNFMNPNSVQFKIWEDSTQVYLECRQLLTEDIRNHSLKDYNIIPVGYVLPLPKPKIKHNQVTLLVLYDYYELQSTVNKP